MKNALIFNACVCAFAGALSLPLTAQAQVAGASSGMGTATNTQLAMGWSAKKAILGKTVYNETGAKVGKVEDLIIDPARSVSYVIVGAGGFVGIGRHDVAVPVTQIQNSGGKLVMAGATKDLVKAMPRFEYTDEKAERSSFMSQVDRDIDKGKADIAALQKKATAASTEAQAAMNVQVTALQADLKATEMKLSEMKSAAASRWKEFQAGVSEANVRMRKSIDKAMA